MRGRRLGSGKVGWVVVSRSKCLLLPDSVAGGMSCEGFRAGHVVRGFWLLGWVGVCLCVGGICWLLESDAEGRKSGDIGSWPSGCHVPLIMVLCCYRDHGLSAGGRELVLYLLVLLLCRPSSSTSLSVFDDGPLTKIQICALLLR